MSLHTEWITFEQNGQEVKLYTARLETAKAPLPVVLVIQEIWGTDKHIQEVTERFAKAGYLAVSPDLYFENGARRPGLEEDRVEGVKHFLESVPPTVWHDANARDEAINALPEPNRTQISESLPQLFSGLARGPEFLKMLTATVDFLKTYEYSKGQKVASIGFCMGGALSAALAANEPSLAGSIVFYGRLPQENEKVQTIQCPVIGFFGSLDEGINGMIPEFEKAMDAEGKSFTKYVYEGAHHAFFNDTRASYNVDAARDAFAKSVAFFREVLV